MVINPAEHATLIGIDEDVLAALQAKARPFVDDPNTVLRRELGLESGASTSGAQPEAATLLSQGVERRPTEPKSPKVSRAGANNKPPRAPKGSLTPEEAFELPLLRVLAEAGGEMVVRDALTRVGDLMSNVLNDEDRFEDDKGVTRWAKRVPFVRLKLVERGLMSKESPRGIWAITDSGREYVTAATN